MVEENWIHICSLQVTPEAINQRQGLTAQQPRSRARKTAAPNLQVRTSTNHSPSWRPIWIWVCPRSPRHSGPQCTSLSVTSTPNSIWISGIVNPPVVGVNGCRKPILVSKWGMFRSISGKWLSVRIPVVAGFFSILNTYTKNVLPWTNGWKIFYLTLTQWGSRLGKESLGRYRSFEKMWHQIKTKPFVTVGPTLIGSTVDIV